MRHIATAVVACAGASFLMISASAEVPIAVVEDVTGSPPGIEFMDYVALGKVIRLGPADTIVLSYLKSCWRETIMGGTVTVGPEQSDVQSGKVERAKVACEAGKMLLTTELASKSAGLVFRDRPRTDRKAAPPLPQFTLYGLSPVFEVKSDSTLVVERLDQPGERREMITSGKPLLRGMFYDFATANIALAAGGIYRANVGAQVVVFKVDPNAKPGQTPIAGRLLRLQPAS